MKFHYLILALIFIISCNQNIKTNQEISEKEPKSIEINRDYLFGAWGSEDLNENAYFGIYKDSIYYVDSNIWEKYELIGDTILHYGFDGEIRHSKILKLNKDTLILYAVELKSKSNPFIKRK